MRSVLLAVALCAAGDAAVPVAANAGTAHDSTAIRPSLLRTRVYFGMWSTHLRDLKQGLSNNALIAVAHRGIYAGTFINSFGDRALTGGVQRSLSPARRGPVTTALGYRVGLITGYDERLFGIGDKLPAFPFVQILGALDMRNVGVELAYAGVVASVSVSWRL